jgi:hypothetical protein
MATQTVHHSRPYGIDFAASGIQMALAASAVPAANRNLFHVLAPLSAAAAGAIREAALPGDMTKQNWLATIAPAAAGLLGFGVLAFMHFGSKRK